MKKLFLIIAGLGFLAAVAGCLLGLSARSAFASVRKGSGKMAVRTLTVPAFDAVRVSRGIEATIEKRRSDEIEIEADDNLLDKVIVKTENGTLKISVDKSVKNLSDYRIAVAIPHDARIRGIDASSAARVICKETLTARNIELEASSAAKIAATVDTDECSLDASSAAEIAATVKAAECSFDLSSASKIAAEIAVRECKIDMSSASSLELSGTAAGCAAETSSASRLDAAALTVGNCRLDSSSGSSARIRCTGELRAEATSGASIRYTGDCRSTVKTSSGGSVHRK